MNFLAHLYLADDDPDSLVGNLLGDFHKGPVDGLPPGLRAGVIRHRRVDSFADAHPLTCISRRRLDPALRRYGGILVDVFYDHFLARHWQDYAGESLESFTRRAYGVLHRRHHQLPPRMQTAVAHMIRHDWLLSYREVAGIERALRGIEGRLRRPSGLSRAVVDLERNYPGFEEDFRAFFPALTAFVAASATDGGEGGASGGSSAA